MQKISNKSSKQTAQYAFVPNQIIRSHTKIAVIDVIANSLHCCRRLLSFSSVWASLLEVPFEYLSLEPLTRQ